MRFAVAAAFSVAAFAVNTFATPVFGTHMFGVERGVERRSSCDCNCKSQCNDNCSNGFGENPIGNGLCILTCTDSCGCGQTEVCCGSGNTCSGYNCCAQFGRNIPNNDRGYAPGWCGIHVIQYQKPDPSVDSYSLHVTLFDANGNWTMGDSGDVGPTASVTSPLPWTVEVSTGGVDSDPVSFAYSDQTWDSNDGSRCSVGGYDSGSRQMDCGFNC